MVKVAVAAGLGQMGRTFVETLIEDGRHEVIILARRPSANALAPVIVVDFTDVDVLKHVLETSKVEAVISTIRMLDEASGQSQLNLIQAAEKSATTTKFIPSDYSIPITPEAINWLPHLQYRVNSYEELKKTNLQWTRFHIGYFLDYYGKPNIKTYQGAPPPAIDIEHKIAAIPGDGNTPITFTYTFDLAKFAVAIIDDPFWEHDNYAFGDRLTWNELLQLAEEVRGAKFEVVFDDIEKLKKHAVTELPVHIPFYSNFPKDKLQLFFASIGYLTQKGTFNVDVPYEKTLNYRFPTIRAMSAKELLEKAWKDKVDVAA